MWTSDHDHINSEANVVLIKLDIRQLFFQMISISWFVRDSLTG